MKRVNVLFTVLFALVISLVNITTVFAAPGPADRTVISEISFTTNMDTILVNGNTISNPSLSIISGDPTIIKAEKFEMYEVNKYVPAMGKEVKPGTYRIDYKLDLGPQESKNYVFDLEISVSVDGVTYNVTPDIKPGPNGKSSAVLTVSYEVLETYTITFDPNGATTSNIEFVDGIRGTYDLPQNLYTEPDGMEFVGWSLTADGDIVSSLDIEEDTTVYAIWKVKKYTVSFDSNGGTGSMDDALEVLGDYVLPDSDFTAPEYKEFAGWALSADGDVISSLNVSENVTLYAIWSDIEYTLSFDANGGDGTMDDVKLIHGTYDLPDSEFIPNEKYAFKGWSLTADGDIITSLDITGDTTVFAIWERVYSYEFLNGDKQVFIEKEVDKYIIEIDGDYNLFDYIIIGDIVFEDGDYIVSEGSTIIEFTEKGLAKLNELKVGDYDVVVAYSNNKEAIGLLTIKEKNIIDVPNTLDGIVLWFVMALISLLSVISIAISMKKSYKNE